MCVCMYVCMYVCVCVCVRAHMPRRVQLFLAPWTVAHQAPLSMGFFKQEYYSGLAFSSPGNLPDAGIEPTPPASPAMAGRFFTAVPPGSPI